jgi:hypothetical protein
MKSLFWVSIGLHKGLLIAALVNTPETAQQAEATFRDTLDRLKCSPEDIAAHLEDARTRAAVERKRLGQPSLSPEGLLAEQV